MDHITDRANGPLLVCERCNRATPHLCTAIVEAGKLRIRTVCEECGLETIGRKQRSRN